MKLLCRLGWHNWLLTHVDHDARPPVGYVSCEDCGKERATFYDGTPRRIITHTEK